ncbi:hypothetical protein GLOIN_2v1775288 [Rhizophagus irregularis DAOM 181602=DAOM 197198]|nr:hypothetical protein GLOIN_2v1775288 [Rhizophagus irregularis DAOM 181602=DAOM 197198]
MDHVKLPSDIGRIPPKIAIGSDGFSNLAADQWKTFIMIYSTAILWIYDLKEAQERLKDMAYLIENSIWTRIHNKLNGYIGSYPTFGTYSRKRRVTIFLSMRHSTSKIYGTEAIPGQLLKPSYLRVVIPSELRMFLCEWYEMLYEKDHDEILGFMDLQINQHARLQIGSEIFGSVIAGCHETNSTILAKWKAFSDETIDIYPGEVQYYFEHTLRLPEGSRTHLLAYVKWYKNAPSSDIRFKHRFIEPELSNTEL